MISNICITCVTYYRYDRTRDRDSVFRTWLTKAYTDSSNMVPSGMIIYK